MKKKVFAILLAITLLLSCLPREIGKKIKVFEEVNAGTILQNPKTVSDSSMDAGQKVTYDCVWFGSYPQTEIVDQESTSGVYSKDWVRSSDYEVDPSLYNILKNATGWNDRGDITLPDGKKYRRIKQEDAIIQNSGDKFHFDWNDPETYHYFRYDKIKWRVLNASGNKALLLADETLDIQMYHVYDKDIAWETSTLRSWLNGYSASSNTGGIDCSRENFIDNAFISAEQEAIQTTPVVNDNDGSSTEGGNNTNDKLFLLSKSQTYSDTATGYGFKSDQDSWDEARRSKSSTYAKAMGLTENRTVNYYGELVYSGCQWWLRSKGDFDENVLVVNDDGYVDDEGVPADRPEGVRPALNLNLSSSNLWSYAGTICTNGTINEDASGDSTHNEPKEQKIAVSKTSYSFTYNSAKAQSQAISVTGAKGKVSYTSSNSKVYVKDGKIVVSKGTPAGPYTIKVSASATANGEYKASNTVTIIIKVNKATNTIKVSPTKKTIKAAKVKKKAQSFKIKVTKAAGKVTYKSNNKKVKVTAKGKVTVKKGTKKGKYMITVTAAGNGNYKKGSKTVTVVVK